LPGGVSATVLAVRGDDLAVVVKQALPRLRVHDVWLAKAERTDTEVEAMRLCSRLTPGAVPRILAHDPVAHVVAMELVPASARNWQAEIGEGRAHVDAAAWAGETLGSWHAATAAEPGLLERLDDAEAFEQLRLHPFHETVMARRPELADAIAPYVAELRSVRRCLVHGDYAAKNMLVEPGEGPRWVLDFETAHTGNPVFDLGFFLSFPVLSAVRWPELADAMELLADGFLQAYERVVGEGFAGSAASIAGHTACLVLARTDGTSPAQFLDGESRVRARAAGETVLLRPDAGLWAWR
jgi:5-methylthioribose kinase